MSGRCEANVSYSVKGVGRRCARRKASERYCRQHARVNQQETFEAEAQRLREENEALRGALKWALDSWEFTLKTPREDVELWVAAINQNRDAVLKGSE